MKKGHTKKDFGSFQLKSGHELDQKKPYRIIQEFYVRSTAGAFKFWVYKEKNKIYRICHESGMLILPLPFSKLEDMEKSIDLATHLMEYYLHTQGINWLIKQIDNQKARAECIYCAF